MYCQFQKGDCQGCNHSILVDGTLHHIKDFSLSFGATSSTKCGESSNSEMLLQCKSCSPDGSPDDLPTSSGRSDDSSEETTTILPQWMSDLGQSSKEESKTVQLRRSSWQSSLWSGRVCRRISLTLKKNVWRRTPAVTHSTIYNRQSLIELLGCDASRIDGLTQIRCQRNSLAACERI